MKKAPPKYEIVKRPKTPNPQSPLGALKQALLETAESGKALRVNGVRGATCRSYGYSVALRRGLRFHAKRDGDEYIIWMEKRSPQ